MLSAAKHLGANHERPFASRGRDKPFPLLLAKLHHRHMGEGRSSLSTPEERAGLRLACLPNAIRQQYLLEVIEVIETL